jgi:hypothetical protein
MSFAHSLSFALPFARTRAAANALRGLLLILICP